MVLGHSLLKLRRGRFNRLLEVKSDGVSIMIGMIVDHGALGALHRLNRVLRLFKVVALLDAGIGQGSLPL